ncbi:hypothetical protein AB0F68_05415 [Micromonospora sp. NPDC023966]|uniref:hypothetical protein n=1 Tax=Micromonospora sp. NPDC023966 TaxID=3154699 RepID=UPI00340D1D85
MLPIALTCPLWWVARWTARMLASLAVLVACSFGAATLPIGGAATAPVAPTVAASVDGLALRAVAVEAAPRILRDDEAVDRPAVSAGGLGSVGALRAMTRPADRPLVLAGLVPATVGSRAPPAG